MSIGVKSYHITGNAENGHPAHLPFLLSKGGEKMAEKVAIIAVISLALLLGFAIGCLYNLAKRSRRRKKR
jgi:hypothetical protein